MSRFRAGIVGGSLAGLTAALTLRDAGWDVELFERAPADMTATGAGLTVQEPSVRYLIERGGAKVEDLTFEVEGVRYLNPDGSVRYEARRPTRFTTWGTLHRGLMELYGTKHYHASHPVLGVTERENGRVYLATESGDEGPFDLVVGADGVNSTVRAAVAPGIALEPAGYLAWRCVADVSRVSRETSDTFDQRLTYCLGDRTHCVIYPVPPREPGGERRINMVWYRNYESPGQVAELLTDRNGVRRPLSVPPGLMAHKYVAEMREAAKALAPQAAEVVAGADEPFSQLIGDLRVPQMVYGRVVLIGDAACVARPHVASGAAKASENAWTLAAALKDWDGDPARLEAWEQDQLRESEILCESGRLQGYRGQVEGTWDPRDPTFDVRSFKERVHG
ncbi:FAD binding domain-containing protein [Amycolatopsis pithecellobii]|uniref:NAD(P)-binding protein n=1 Tax=Amycolatopsis pithecellobii TaxID=664692 RepID=A0A6N7Z4U2_9PSEU|nr:FAD-dependent monooxygenase [Amycolatopsis pithecellobii]MTD54306.1 NAD(P)-binding protein [Amycolatopsis pithecellobii]